MIVLISAITLNNAIGKNNKLLYTLKGDLANFKNMTSNQTIIMGKNTYKSLPGLLPNRRNIVISKTLKDNKVEVFPSLIEAINSSNTENTFLIGGNSIYKEGMKYATHMVLTHICDISKDADTFFPEIDFSKWNILNTTKFNEKDVNYSIVVYERKPEIELDLFN